MLNGKLISIKEIIFKVYRDTGIQDELNWSDMVEIATECLEQIYYPSSFQKKVLGHISDPNLNVTNYRFKIPCDLVHLTALTIDGYRALPATNSFHQLMDGSCCGVDEFVSQLSEGTFVDGFGNIFAAGISSYPSGPITYELNNDWITLNVKEGKVCIAYLAFPVDCDGFPLIPDDVSFKEAISRAIIVRLDYIRWRQNPSDNGLRSLHEHSEQQYCWYVAQAKAVSKMPSVDQMENMKNMLLRLKPNINAWVSNFNTLNSSEKRYIK